MDYSVSAFIGGGMKIGQLFEQFDLMGLNKDKIITFIQDAYTGGESDLTLTKMEDEISSSIKLNEHCDNVLLFKGTDKRSSDSYITYEDEKRCTIGRITVDSNFIRTYLGRINGKEERNISSIVEELIERVNSGDKTIINTKLHDYLRANGYSNKIDIKISSGDGKFFIKAKVSGEWFTRNGITEVLNRMINALKRSGGQLFGELSNYAMYCGGYNTSSVAVKIDWLTFIYREGVYSQCIQDLRGIFGKNYKDIVASQLEKVRDSIENRNGDFNV